MKTPRIFPDTPRVTKADVERLARFLGNLKIARKWVRTKPSEDDAKRAVLIELASGRDWQSRGIVSMLICHIQRIERHAIWWEIQCAYDEIP